jgi:hypothetical protein
LQFADHSKTLSDLTDSCVIARFVAFCNGEVPKSHTGNEGIHQKEILTSL